MIPDCCTAGTRRTSIILLIAAFAAGLGSIISQTTLIRIFLEIFSGNELTLGIILCNWMLLTGTGAFLSPRIFKNPGMTTLAWLMAFASFMPLLAGWLINQFRNSVFEPGVMIDFTGIFLSSLLLLLPFCMLSGALFPVVVNLLSHSSNKDSIAPVYSAESAGSILGGLLSGVVLVTLTSNFFCLKLVSVLFTGVCLLFLLSCKKIRLLFPFLLASAVLVIWLGGNFEKAARSALYHHQQISEEQTSPYGNIVITSQNEQLSFFLNGELLFSTRHVAANEESVHFAMLQRKNVKKALIVSGEIAGIKKETEKYPHCTFDFVEENRWLLELQQKYFQVEETGNFRIIHSDARLFLRNTERIWDVIIINHGDPLSLQSNRYFTTEFFTLAKKHLSRDGVFCISLSTTAEYLGKQARNMHSGLFRTLAEVFRFTIILQGVRDYYLSSDTPLIYYVAERADSCGINNLYVNTGYMDEQDFSFRNEQLIKNMDPEAEINRDFKPVISYFYQQYWLGMAGKGYAFILIILGVLLVLPVFFSRITRTGIWMSGFTGASTEVLLLMAYPALYGNLYQMTALIFAVFMAGLALSALVLHFVKKIPSFLVMANPFILALYGLVFPFVLIFLHQHVSSSFIIHLAVFILTFVIAFLCGVQFILFARLESGSGMKNAGTAYGFDLLGSSAGAVFISALMLPVSGIIYVSFLVATLNLITGAVLVWKRKKVLSL